MSRKLGQVFLKSKHIQEKIANYVLGLEGCCFVEIGPGSGAITEYVYEKRSSDLIMVEVDERLIGHLSKSFPEAKLIHGDIITVDLGDCVDASVHNVIFGNIPYYITSPIITKFLEDDAFKEAVFMVQKEYYETISAKHGTSRYSCMSVLVQSFVGLKKVLSVDRQNFYPVPKVDSTVVHLIKDKNGDLDFGRYSMFLRKCFGMPRKTLWNNLRKHFNQQILERVFRDEEIQTNTRPEQQSHEFFVALFKLLDF